MALHPAEDRYVIRLRGPLAVTRACRLCKFYQTRRLGARTGRGTGMREGNKQRGVLIQHLKEAHPVEYAAAMKGEE